MWDVNVLAVSGVIVVMCVCLVAVIIVQGRLINRLSKLVMAERMADRNPGLAYNMLRDTIASPPVSTPPAPKEDEGIRVRMGG